MIVNTGATMDHKDFEIGRPFLSGGREFICTDKGTRVVIALPTRATLVTQDRTIEMGKHEMVEGGWYDGPPYAMEELVFDENDMLNCEPV